MNDAEPLREGGDLRALATVLRALSTPRRLAVLHRLQEGPAVMQDLNNAAGAARWESLEMPRPVGLQGREGDIFHHGRPCLGSAGGPGIS